jgi:transcriptional regulator with PAS, ATPase and Fis domain
LRDDHFPSTAMRHVYARALQAAKLETFILLLGESGVGKDYLASWIHSHSRRSDGPYFSINCASISRDLFESEIFGYEPGAFTGAKGRKRGLLELAQKGTLLLNEIGELDLGLQSKLLSFLDTRSFPRVGGERTVTVDTRIIAATNRDLQREVEEGRFRRDLYYRLSVFPIVIPPLGERPEDIEVLAGRLLPKLAAQMGMTHVPVVDPAAMEALRDNPWPGNVRELINVLERALILAGSGPIMPWHVGQGSLPSSGWKLQVPFHEGRSLHDVTAMVTRELIQEALRRTQGNRGLAAALLGISRHALAYQMRTVGLHPENDDSEA